mgnify:CR=1 FL=1
MKELDRAVTKLGMKGALINGHTRGSYLDDRKYWGLFECAQALDVPIYLHPTRQPKAVLDASGYVTARRQATVASKVTGRVQELLLEEGDAVFQTAEPAPPGAPKP